MDGKDKLFDLFQKAEQRRVKRNFDVFITEVERGVIEDLDKKYESDDVDGYERLVSNLKSIGIKVLRNSNGKHKLKY